MVPLVGLQGLLPPRPAVPGWQRQAEGNSHPGGAQASGTALNLSELKSLAVAPGMPGSRPTPKLFRLPLQDMLGLVGMLRPRVRCRLRQSHQSLLHPCLQNLSQQAPWLFRLSGVPRALPAQRFCLHSQRTRQGAALRLLVTVHRGAWTSSMGESSLLQSLAQVTVLTTLTRSHRATVPWTTGGAGAFHVLCPRPQAHGPRRHALALRRWLRRGRGSLTHVHRRHLPVRMQGSRRCQ